jgi:hypothetical protein
MTRVLITGDRNWNCVQLAKDIVRRLMNRYGEIKIIHGCCRGVDLSFAEACESLFVLTEEHPADWSRGKREGPDRNLRMIKSEPDFVIAFHRNIRESRGTANCVEQALVHKLKVYLVYNEDGDIKEIK